MLFRCWTDGNVPLYLQIMPNTLKENSFWTRANEEALADDDILKGLQNKFASKPVAKKANVEENNNKNKKVSQRDINSIEILYTSALYIRSL